MCPTALGYTSYLPAIAYGGSFAEGLAAALPRYWINARVAEALVDRGSPDPGAWIRAYAGAAFAQVVAEARPQPCPGPSPMTMVQGRMVHEVTKPF